MGGWKQKEESSLLVPSTFLFLYQPSVCLCVSRVRAYLTTNQHFGHRSLRKSSNSQNKKPARPIYKLNHHSMLQNPIMEYGIHVD